MITTNHTPGKWEAVPSELDPKKHNFAIVGDHGTRLIADVYKKFKGEQTEAQANAFVLAAAPELLEVAIELDQFKKNFEEGNPELNTEDKMNELWAKARTAVNNALFGFDEPKKMETGAHASKIG